MKNTGLFDDGQGLMIVGRHVNRGTALPPQYDGTYFFGMWSRQERHTESGEEHLPGRIFTARMEPGADATWPWSHLYLSNRPNGEFDSFLLGFGQNAEGDVFALASDEVGPTGDTGRVYRLTAE